MTTTTPTARLTTEPAGKGRVHLVADGNAGTIVVGTAKQISCGFWEADLWRSHPSRGPQACMPGRGPMQYGLPALRAVLEESIARDGAWWL